MSTTAHFLCIECNYARENVDCEFKLAISPSMTCSLESLLPSPYDPLFPLVCHAYLILSPLVFW